MLYGRSCYLNIELRALGGRYDYVWRKPYNGLCGFLHRQDHKTENNIHINNV